MSISRAILHTPITEVVVKSTEQCEFTGAHGIELPEQDEYIDEIVIKFNSGYSLHILAWYDYMHVFIRDKDGKIPSV